MADPRESMEGNALHGNPVPQDISLASIAISMVRIADALELISAGQTIMSEQLSNIEMTLRGSSR